jgi:glycerol-3-phosphate dehydrogenase
MRTVEEPARSTPVVAEVDVAVCGGGPAGVAVALASVRTGACTMLIEQHGCLAATAARTDRLPHEVKRDELPINADAAE